MKSKIKKRLIAFMLCMVLVLSSAISAFADDLDTQAQDQTTTMADEPVATSMDDSTDEQQPVAEAEENQEQAVETQEEQQTEENVSEEPTTEDSSAVAEQEAIEKESDVSIQTTVNGTTITMSGPHSSFPEGNNYEISASELNEEETKDVEIALKKKEDETNTKIATYKAYDIKLLVDGIETQPTGDVNVKFEGGEVKENLTNAENVEVYHVDESNQTANDISGITAEDTVTMTTNHFSTYVITTTKDGGVDITVQHYLQNTTTPLYRDSTVHLNKGQEIKDLSSPSNYTAQKVVKVNRDGSADTELLGDEVITDNQTYRVYYTATTGTSDESVQMFDYQVKGKLKNYVTQVNMKTSIDQSAESVKTYAKKAVDALKHNYIENGTFESGNLDGWKLSDSENIIATNDEYLGNVASITRGTSNIYMYQSWKLKAGTYTVRFKAGADLRSISKARIRVSLGGISYYTKAGELDDEVFKQYETEITISSAGTKYFYVYNYVDNTTVYIKDVEVLGKYEDHAEAQFTVANDAIEAEVKRAEGIEDELRAAIKVNAGNITSKVEKGDMGSYITQYYNNVLIAFNKDSKYVQISAGQIAIYNGEVTTTGKRAVFDQSGNSFYRDNYFVGRIGTNQWKDNNAHKGLTFDLEYQGKYMAWARAASSGATTYDTILCYSRANSIYTEAGLHVGCNMYLHNYELHNVRLSGTGVKYNNTWYNGYTGTIPICTAISIQSTGNGGISWSYSTSYIRVADGVIVGYWT